MPLLLIRLAVNLMLAKHVRSRAQDTVMNHRNICMYFLRNNMTRQLIEMNGTEYARRPIQCVKLNRRRASDTKGSAQV